MLCFRNNQIMNNTIAELYVVSGYTGLAAQRALQMAARVREVCK